MKTSKKRIWLSGISILLVLSLLAGGTMAWFTDTEKVHANFTAGVLDVTVNPDKPAGTELDFKNLRPLTLKEFDAELQVNEDGTVSNVNEIGYGPKPIYFQPVTVRNDGTLPAVINFSVQDRGPQADDVANVLDNGNGGVKQDGVLKCDEAPYILKDVLEIVVYENKANADEKANWVRVEDVNLNEAAKAEPEGYTLPNTLAANESVQYVIGGYLPEDTKNRYQSKHFHGYFTVNAYQVEDPDAGEVTPPEQPVTKDVEVKWVTKDGTQVDSTYAHKVTFLNGATKAKLFPNTEKLDNRYELATPGDSRDITLDKETGAVSPVSVTFTVQLKTGGDTDPDPGEHPEAYQVRVDFVDKKIPATVFTSKTYSGLAKGSYSFKAADAEELEGNVYSIAVPEGYEYDPAAVDQREQAVSIPVENGPAVVTFIVKKQGGTDPEEPENPDCPDPNYKHIIKTAADLDNVRNHPHCNFVVANDIDLSADFPNWTPIGEMTKIYDPWNGTTYVPSENVFTGDFNGNGKSITGMNVGTLKSFNGLFAYSSGTIRNLNLDGKVNAHSMSGVLVGENEGIIQNCSVSGSIMAGSRTANIWQLGGITGVNSEKGTISGTASHVDVTANPAGYQAAAHYYYGGIAGENDGTLINSYSTGTVKGARAGGLCGYNAGDISYCYTTSKVYALIDSNGNTDTWTHPTVGEMENGTSGKILADTVFFQKGNLYRNNQVYTGWDTDKYRGTGKTADEMQTATTYTGANWNSSIWNITDGGYPTLK